MKGCKKTKYIKWDRIRNASRVPAADRTTVAKAFTRAGLKAKWRPSREKPQRTKEHREEREVICGKMAKKPVEYYEGLDLIQDNKMWPVPTTDAARDHLQQEKVKGPESSKPSKPTQKAARVAAQRNCSQLQALALLR